MFAHPHYFLALWLVPVLLGLRVWAQHSAGRAANSFVAQRLRDLLLTSSSPVLGWCVFVLQLLAFTLFVAALAEPHWGEDKRTITESGRNVIIAVDTSKSMMADDLQPNRLTRAKLAAQDMIALLRDERIGLIAFAGRAYLQAPLTTDHDAVIESLQNLDTFTIPRGGSVISEAVKEAISAFEKTKARSHGLIIFSDGAEDDPELDAMLKKATEKHVVIISVGVGTDTGSLIPDPDPERAGDYVRDPATGNPVHSKLEEATLRKMADATNGRYLKVGAQTLTNSVVTQVLSTLDTMETGNREEIKPIQRFYWPLGLGIFALMLSLFLRPRSSRAPRYASVLVLLLLLGTSSSEAAVLSSNDALLEAQREFKAQNFTRARDLYSRLLAENPPPGREQELAYGLGAATLATKEYERANEAFSRALRSPVPDTQVRAHRGLGNTLYDQGAKVLQSQPDVTVKAWTDSVSHYESALSIREDRDVRENMEFVKKHLEQLKQQQEQQKQQQQQQQNKQDKKDQGQKGDKKDQKGEGEDEEEQQNKDGDQKKDGEQQKPGDQKEGDKKDGKQGEGEEQQSKEGEKIPEGKLEAAEGEKPGDKESREMQEMREADEKQDGQTGFSKNEARSLLRTYNDQMQLQFQQRRARDRDVKRNW